MMSKNMENTKVVFQLDKKVFKGEIKTAESPQRGYQGWEEH